MFTGLHSLWKTPPCPSLSFASLHLGCRPSAVVNSDTFRLRCKGSQWSARIAIAVQPSLHLRGPNQEKSYHIHLRGQSSRLDTELLIVKPIDVIPLRSSFVGSFWFSIPAFTSTGIVTWLDVEASSIADMVLKKGRLQAGMRVFSGF